MIDAAKKIFERFRDHAIFRGTEYWFDAAGAVSVLLEAQKQSLELLGWDAARLDDKYIYPIAESSWDYCRERVDDPYAHAVQFLNERMNTDLRFSIVFS